MADLKHKELISKLTLEEKASLIVGKNFWETQNIDRLEIPSIFLADGPHGIRRQIASADHLGLNESTKATCFPTASALASSWNVELANKVGIALGQEARYQDVNVLLGPGLNTKRNVLCGRNFEYFSEDPFLAGKMAANIVNGIQQSGVSACLKHFACNSQELRRMNVDSIVDERALRELYLTNFEIAVKEGKPNCIMSSYNPVNGTYANENSHLNDILRKEWGYKGVMVTDWGGANDHIKGLIAGSDLEMPTTAGDTKKEIIKAVNGGTLDEKVLNTAVDRILDLVFKTQKDKNKTYKCDLEANHKLAVEAAEESIVLLENDGILPLKNVRKVCIVGKFAEQIRYQGAGSSKVNSFKEINLLSLIPSYDINYIGYSKGFEFNNKVNDGLIKKAVELANQSDIVIAMVGLDELSEAEGIDRESMKLPEAQLKLVDELIKTNKKIIVCLCSGSAVELPFAKKVNALVHYHLSGQGAMEALLNILVGKVCPSGKLSETYPLKYEDNPTLNYFHKKLNTAEYRESIYVGYRYYGKNEIPVRYPFGYGKSYTEFKYTVLNVRQNGVSFKVTNIGEVEGKEVAQLYVSIPGSRIFRANKELKGFAKVSLKPGEAKEVFIPFDEFTFRFFNVKSNKWEIEGGYYNIYIATNSNENMLKGTIKIAGDLSTIPYDPGTAHSYFDGIINNLSDNQFKAVLGRDIPNGDIKFVKRNRIDVDIFTTVEQLRYAKGWSGRLFSRLIRFAIWFLKKIGKGKTANTLIMGVYNLPLRGLSRMSGGKITWEQLMGLLLMFNGHFFKGLHKFNKEGRAVKKERKALKKAQKEEEAAKLEVPKEIKEEPQVVEEKPAVEEAKEQPIEIVEEPSKETIVSEEVTEPEVEEENNEEIPALEEVNETVEEFNEE